MVADDDDGHEAGVAGGELARLRDPRGGHGVLPCVREDPFLLGAEDLGVGEPRERQRDAGVEPRCQIVLRAAHTLVVVWSWRIRWASVPMIEIAILGSDSSSFRNPRRGIAITSISVSATTEAERTPPSSSAISPK